MIRKSSHLWNFVNFFSLISCITVIFFNRFSLEALVLLFYLLLFCFIITVL